MRSKLIRKWLVFGIVFVLVFVVFVGLSMNVSAVPPIPDGYTGNVYSHDSITIDGLKVKACVDGVFYDNDAGTISSGSYSLLVYGDDPATSEYKEGALGFETIIFWVEDYVTVETKMFQSGGGYETNNLNIWPDYSPKILKINEIMVNPTSGNEWIELYNPSTNNIALNDYYISNNDDWRINLYGMNIPGQGFLQVDLGSSIILQDSPGDEIKLDWRCPYSWIANNNYVTIDRVEYGIPSGTQAGHGPDNTLLSNALLPALGQSLILFPDGDDNDDPMNDFVITSTPSPGASNYIINNPPVADVDGPYEADEGSEVTFDASDSTDPDGDDLQYRWDFENDGTWDTSYSTDSTAAHTWYDDYSGEVSVEVYDGEYTDTDTTTVTINNVAPTLTLSGASTVDEGSVYTLGLNSYDPGDDTITEWEIDWGDGTMETIPGNPSSVTHIYVEGPNAYTISATAMDEDCIIGSGNTLITDYLNDRVIEVDHESNIVWEITDLTDPIDAERLDNGNTIIVERKSSGPGNVMEIDNSGTIIWQYDTDLSLPNDAERLVNGNTLIADEANDRVIEVAPDKSIVWEMDTGLNNPKDVERLDNGNTLIADLYSNSVIEVEPDFTEVWRTPHWGGISLQDCERLDNGNTLITGAAGFNRVREIQSDYTIMWDYIAGTWVADAERLPNGNTLIADGYGVNRVYEVDNTGIIVWEVTGISLNWPYDVERLEGSMEPYDASNTIELTVNNVAPSVSIDNVIQPNSEFIFPNDVLEFYGSFTDPGILDTHTIECDFDDSTIVTGTLTPTHAYSEAGEYTVTLSVTDDDGGIGTASIVIVIESAEEATEIINEDIQELPGDAFKNNADNRKNAFYEKLDEVIELIEDGDYEEAIDKLENDIRKKCDGSLGGNSKNDWITDADAQAELCAMIDTLVEYLETLV